MTAAPISRAAWAILIAGSLAVSISLGIRHGFGLFLDPVSTANGWGRESFGLAIAVQNLVWGLAQPFAGLLADRHGAARVVAAGGALYALGLALMAQPLGEAGFMLAAGVLVGLGLAGATFPVVFGALARVIPAEQRSLAFGISMAIGSFGQFVMLPLSLTLIDALGWAGAFLALAGVAALAIPLALPLRAGAATLPQGPADAGAAFRAAMGSRDFLLLAAGFFVCGFQVVLIAVHLPAFLADQGLPVSVATTALALIGLVNIAGNLAAGWLGGRYRKPWLLAGLYAARSVAIAFFAFLPVTAWGTWAFAAVMGLLWLSTVPLTNGAVASMFGVRNLSMLGGLVFLSHQIGSFLGGWLGGAIYDRTGSYDVAWGVAIALGVLAALLNLPIRDGAVPVRRVPA